MLSQEGGCEHAILKRIHTAWLKFRELSGLLIVKGMSLRSKDDVVLCHTFPVFTGLGWCPIVNWDFVGAVSIFGPDALPIVHQ